MNILVTGANGQLGCSLREILSKGSSKACVEHGGDYWYFSDISKREGFPTYFLDITDPEEIGRVVRDMEIDAVINCAGYTDVEKAEDEEDKASFLNGKAVGYLAEAMAFEKGLLLHISTDYVFSGACTPITEEASPSPLSAYGRSKLLGEKALRESGCKYVLLRTSWLYSEYGKNFLRTMLSLLDERPEVNVVFDQCGTPTYAGDLAKAIIAVIEDYKNPSVGEGYPKAGTYNFSNEGVCSWFDFARMIAEYSGKAACKILPCHSSEFPAKAIRPSYSVLDKTLIKKTFGLSIPHWTSSLKECLGNI